MLKINENDISEEEIQEYLNTIIECYDLTEQFDIGKVLKFFAKLLYNLRYDLADLKTQLIKYLKGEEEPIPPLDEDHGGFYS